MSRLAILHLSDMHFSDTNGYDEDHIRNIVNALHDNVVGVSNLLIIHSGDLAFSGQEEQYKGCTAFINSLKEAIYTRESQIHNIEFVSVPGNHDIDYTQGPSYDAQELKAIVEGGLCSKLLPVELQKLSNYETFAIENKVIENKGSLINRR